MPQWETRIEPDFPLFLLLLYLQFGCQVVTVYVIMVLTIFKQCLNRQQFVLLPFRNKILIGFVAECSAAKRHVAKLVLIQSSLGGSKEIRQNGFCDKLWIAALCHRGNRTALMLYVYGFCGIDALSRTATVPLNE